MKYLLLGCVQFACCMGGWKEIHGTVLCSAPCCPGYTMKVERPPLLAPLVYCRCCSLVYVFSGVYCILVGRRESREESRIQDQRCIFLNTR